MREYELTVVYDLAVMEAGGPDASVEQLTHAVEARGGKVLRTDHWGRRRMAYPIRRTIDADYVVTRIELDPTAVEPLESTLRIDERVLRHLIVRADELPPPAPPREQRPAAVEAPASATEVTPEASPETAVETPAATDSVPTEEPASAEEPISGAEAVAAAEGLTAEQQAPAPEAEAAPPTEEPLRDTPPEPKAAEDNTGISVEAVESRKAAEPHAEEDTPADETTA